MEQSTRQNTRDIASHTQPHIFFICFRTIKPHVFLEVLNVLLFTCFFFSVGRKFIRRGKGRHRYYCSKERRDKPRLLEILIWSYLIAIITMSWGCAPIWNGGKSTCCFKLSWKPRALSTCGRNCSREQIDKPRLSELLIWSCLIAIVAMSWGCAPIWNGEKAASCFILGWKPRALNKCYICDCKLL